MIYAFEAAEKAVLRANECKKIFVLRPRKSFFSRHGREDFGIKGLRDCGVKGFISGRADHHRPAGGELVFEHQSLGRVAFVRQPI